MTTSATDWRCVSDEDNEDGPVWWLTDGKKDVGKIFDAADARLAASAPRLLAAMVSVSDWMLNRGDIAYDDPMHRFVLRVIAETKGYESRLV
jgi:hypothetical protein